MQYRFLATWETFSIVQTSPGNTNVDSLKVQVRGPTAHLDFPRRASFQKLRAESETLPVWLGFPSGWSGKQPAKYPGRLERWPRSMHRVVLGVCVGDMRHRSRARPAERTLCEWPGHVQEIESIPNTMGCLAGAQSEQPSRALCCSLWGEAYGSGRAGLER